MERRTLVRLADRVGIGVPIPIEVATVLGLSGPRVGDGGDGTPTETPAEATPPADAVGVGDELRLDAPTTDAVTGAEVRTVDGERTLVLIVEGTNDAETGYELRLDAPTTDAGTTVPGGGRSDQIPPGGPRP